MTKLNLECPICEFVFSAAPSNSVAGMIQCPHCRHSFRLPAAKAPAAPPKATAASSKATAASSKATVAPPKATRSAAPPVAPPVAPPPVASASVAPENESNELANLSGAVRSDAVRSDIHLRRRQANRRSNILMVLLALGTIASIGLLAWRFHQLQQPPEPIPIFQDLSESES